MTITARLRLAALLMFCIASASCADEPVWHKPGASMALYERDRADCRQTALAAAREASFSGREVIEEIRVRRLERCLAARGWELVPPNGVPDGMPEQIRAENETTPLERAAGQTRDWPARIEGRNVIVKDGPMVEPPPGFSPVRVQRSVFGPTLVVRTFYRGPDNAALEIAVQKNALGELGAAHANIPPGFFLYSREKLHESEAPTPVDILFGDPDAAHRRGTRADMAFAASLSLDHALRLILAASQPLPAREASPSPGLRLTPSQFGALEDFHLFWINWLIRLETPESDD